jgi:hypothetical protein
MKTDRPIAAQEVKHWIKEAAIDIARETYDRFVMGGWEPQDAHAEIAMIIAAHAPEPATPVTTEEK